MPFQLFATSWIDAAKFAQDMNSLNLAGLRFRPIHIKPFYAVGKGEDLQGVQVYITDHSKAELSIVQFYVMQELAKMYPDHKIFDTADTSRFSMFDKVCGSKEIRARFTKNYKVSDIKSYWDKDAAAFKVKSAKYHLYN